MAKKRKSRKGRRKSSARKSVTRRARSRKGGKRKSAKRVRAGKKAAATRRRNKLARSGKRRRKGGKRRKGGRRKSRKGGRRRSRRTRRVSRRRRRPLWRRYKGRTLKRARSNIKKARRGKLGRKARAYARRYRMRTNPGLGGIIPMLKGVLKATLPVVGGYVATRKIASFVPNFAGSHSEPVKAALMLVGVNILTNKVRVLNRFKAGIMVGAGLALVKAVVSRYLPSVAGTLGLGEYVEMPGSLSDYVYQSGVGDYVDVSSDYSDVGALEELGNAGVMQEMGSLGSWSPKMLVGAIPTRGTAAMIHSRANSMEVPAWAPSADEEFYQGIFANRMLRDQG